MASKERKSPQGGVRIHSVKYNVVMNMILTSSSFLFPLITTPYVSRVLSTTGTGAVSFVQNVAHYFSLVAMLGVRYYGTRACAQVRDNPKELAKTVREILSLLMVSTAIVTVVYFGALFVVPRFGEERELFLIFSLYIWLTSLGVEWFYQALEQYDYITVRSIVFKLISLVLMFVFVREHDDYIIYGGIVIFASVASNILNIIRLNRLVDLHSPQEMDIWHHLKPMKWFAIALISSGMYVSVDIVLLGFLGTTHMVGLYQLVSKIKSVLVSCVNAVGNVMLPRLAHYQSSGNEKASNSLISKSFNFVSIIGGAIISLLAICAMPTVLIMGGADFVDSAAPLACVGPAVLFSALNIVLANYLIAHDQEKSWATVNVLG
ncbi:MAG: oligosaccharide flippase family protein, partial [Atopobiaceae bacterium]|nr:oligosaccharide flippase family protein [Atopobiaceae bacterium]